MEAEIKEAINRVSQSDYGSEALDILYNAAHFSSGKMRAGMFVHLVSDPIRLNAALRLLSQHSLVDLADIESTFTIKSSIQRLVRKILKKQKRQMAVLQEALFVAFCNVRDKNCLNHIMAILRHASEYEELIETMIGFPIFLMDKLFKENNHCKAYAIANSTMELFTKTFSHQHSMIVRLQIELAKFFLIHLKYSDRSKGIEILLRHQRQIVEFDFPYDVNYADPAIDFLILMELIIKLQQLLMKFDTLHSAAAEGNLSKNNNFIGSGTGVNLEDTNARTPLHEACEQGRLSAVELLLTKGAMYDVKDALNKTPLQICSNEEVRELLISVKNAFKIVKAGRTKRLSELISEHPVIVNAQDSSGHNLLHQASWKCNTAAAQLLLDVGVDPTHVSVEGRTPLHVAASKKCVGIVEMFLQSVHCKKLQDFVDAKIPDQGTTALHIAAEKGDVEMMQCLLKHGASFDIRNNRKETPRMFSKKESTRNLLDLIERCFLDVNKGNSEVVSELQKVKPEECWAIMNARDTQNHTLLQAAVMNKQKTIARDLIKIIQEAEHYLKRNTLLRKTN
ncbi:hypothetical protein TNIN_380861 [Trichonephila inaurata madagascariensis]|uniref:Uncharacterized protein n=1 Tax=Trichonephila inaurata madagascariensis TaxID=2747483 RepID=A0A8X6XGW9_9ARAC|nr:hypothetical protein TNIN_380861 [Trichonephila inaurata madagascariensis]